MGYDQVKSPDWSPPVQVPCGDSDETVKSPLLPDDPDTAASTATCPAVGTTSFGPVPAPARPAEPSHTAPETTRRPAPTTESTGVRARHRAAAGDDSAQAGNSTRCS